MTPHAVFLPGMLISVSPGELVMWKTREPHVFNRAGRFVRGLVIAVANTRTHGVWLYVIDAATMQHGWVYEQASLCELKVET
jgi:hypothetical protein